METIGNLDHMTGGMLYLSITHLQREDSIASFGCVGHVRQPYGLGAVTASTRVRKRAHAMPNGLASCASTMLFTFHRFYAVHQSAT